MSDGDIADDYALTRVGREPAREMIMQRLSKEPLFASNNEAAMNMFTCRYAISYAPFYYLSFVFLPQPRNYARLSRVLGQALWWR